MHSIRSFYAALAILAAGLLPHFSPSAQAAEIQILFNTTEIVDGDNTASALDGTIFGVQTVGAGNLARTFKIKNTSATAGDNLNLTGTPRVVIGGTNPGDFVVTTQPTTPVAPGASTTVVITWAPTFGGIHNATLSIANNDSNENPYNFAIQATAQLKLTYTAGTNGSLTGTTPQTVNHGSSGTAVTAVPATGYSFVNWSDGVLTAARTDTNVTANKSVTANFAINTYTLTYTAGANGSLTGTTPQTVNHGTSGTAITAVADADYRFVNWSDGSTANPRTDANVTTNKSVTANFAINTYTLTYTADFFLFGWLDGTTPQTVNHGSSGTAITAVPYTGYSFVNWSDGVLTAARTDTNVTANKTVNAIFTPNTYTLAYTAGANGSLTGTTPQTVDHGRDGTAVTAVPAPNYRFVSWSDGVLTAARTDTKVTAAKNVTASFAIDTYTLTYTLGANGSLTGTTSQVVYSTQSGTPVTAVPATGYHFVNWSDGSTANPRTDTNVTTNRTVIANFAISDGALFTDDHVYLTLEQSTGSSNSWQTLPLTPSMVASDGKVAASVFTLASPLHRLRISMANPGTLGPSVPSVGTGIQLVTKVVLFAFEQSTDNLGSWQTLPVTAGMVTSDGKIDVGALDNSKFYRTKINDTTFPYPYLHLPNVGGGGGPPVYAKDSFEWRVANLHQVAFGRGADAGFVTYWSNAMYGGATVQQVATGIANSTEFTTATGGMNDTDFVNYLYQTTFGRAGEASGVAFWRDALANGATRADLLISFEEVGF
jgi:hypothetical protein